MIYIKRLQKIRTLFIIRIRTMNKIKFIKAYACMLLLLAGVSAYAQNNVIDEVVWVVGDEAILKSDVENERLNAQYETGISTATRIV